MFSQLQKHILVSCFQKKSPVFKKEILEYYIHQDKTTKKEYRMEIVTKSIDRLICRGLVIGYGIKTAQKWIPQKIRLTRQGRKKARAVIGIQGAFKF